MQKATLDHSESVFVAWHQLISTMSGLRLSIDKCQFCQPQFKYVGHIVSKAGIATDPEKVTGVAQWQPPTNLKSLQSFLGFCGYYRKFIASYSSVVFSVSHDFHD